MMRQTLCLLARRHLNRARLSDFVDWAVFMLEQGYDTEHLRMLASLGPVPLWADITYFFGQTAQELNLIVPPGETLLGLYAKDIAQSILEGTVPPETGCHEIYGIYLDLDCPTEMTSWLYLDDNLEPETYQELEGEKWSLAIRQEAWRFLQETKL